MISVELGKSLWNVKELLSKVYDGMDVEDDILLFNLLHSSDCVLFGLLETVIANLQHLVKMGMTSSEDINQMMLVFMKHAGYKHVYML